MLIFRDRQSNRPAKAVESEDLTLKTDRYTYTILEVKITGSRQTDGQTEGLRVVIMYVDHHHSQYLLLSKVSPERRRRKESILGESKLNNSSHLHAYGYLHIFSFSCNYFFFGDNVESLGRPADPDNGEGCRLPNGRSWIR